MPGECRRHAGERADAQQGGRAGTTGELQYAGPRRPHEGRIQGAVHRRDLGTEPVEAPCLPGAGELADGLARPRRIGEQVEARALQPVVTRQPLRRAQGDMVLERAAARLEQRLEHVAHGEHARPGIQHRIADRDRAHLAARLQPAFQHRDGDPAMRQVDRRGESAHAGADDRHAVSPASGCRTVVTSPSSY